MAHRFGQILFQEKHIAKVAVRLGKFRSEPQRLLIVGNGLIELALALAGDYAKQVMSVGVRGIGFEDVLTNLFRLAQIACLQVL